MPAPITSRPFVPPTLTLTPTPPTAGTADGPGFADLLRAAVEGTATAGKTADANVLAALSGGDVTQVEVLASVKKADLALRMMMQVRNKVLDAYNEVQQLRF